MLEAAVSWDTNNTEYCFPACGAAVGHSQQSHTSQTKDTPAQYPPWQVLAPASGCTLCITAGRNFRTRKQQTMAIPSW
jgi:hypothetical protein